ncbi:MAG: hypothetical protein AB1749_13760 [Pseudomonadota bacterium]
MDEKTERQIAHLAMIQAVIARMASNSFTLKTLTVTLSAGVIALLGSVKTPSVLYPLAAIGPVLIFGWMDAMYLRLERLYRRLYDDVRRGAEMEPYDMCVDRYEAQVDPLRRIALSWSISSIYMALLAVLLILSVGVLWAA